MRILMLSSDRAVFDTGSRTRARMEAYAEALGELDIVLFTLKKHGHKRIVRSGTLTVCPTDSHTRLLYGWHALRSPCVRERIDAVTAQDPFEIGLLGLLISWWLKVPLQVQIHTDLFNPAFARHSWWNHVRWLMARIVLARADRVRTVSSRIKNDVEVHVREATRKQISLLPIYVDIDHFKHLPRDEKLAARFKKFTHRVLVVSRLESEKNVALAIDSFAKAAVPDACLIIVGQGRERAMLGALARERGVADRVFFEGGDPLPYYPLADLLLVPSHYEGYGMVIIEAIAAGIPVLSRDVGIAPEAGARIAEAEAWPTAMREMLASNERAILLSYPYTDWNNYVRAWRNDIAACLPLAHRFAAISLEKPLIGFIGQGFIGKNYADDFERRGYETVRYALEEPYRGNKEKIKECDITLIAVPTPSTPEGFDASIVREALKLIGKSKIAVVKSTILPGTTAQFQKENPDITVLYSPEFLSEATAAYDAAHPYANIVGMTIDSPAQMLAAEKLLSILPEAPFAQVCTSTEAEIVKYTHNMSGYVQIVFFNMVYDIARHFGLPWDNIRDAAESDPYICNRYARPIHKSGRGAGGHCFIKDVAALRMLYECVLLDDPHGAQLFRALERKNIDLLTASNKDLDLLKGVYGERIEL